MHAAGLVDTRELAGLGNPTRCCVVWRRRARACVSRGRLIPGIGRPSVRAAVGAQPALVIIGLVRDSLFHFKVLFTPTHRAAPKLFVAHIRRRSVKNTYFPHVLSHPCQSVSGKPAAVTRAVSLSSSPSHVSASAVYREEGLGAGGRRRK